MKFTLILSFLLSASFLCAQSEVPPEPADISTSELAEEESDDQLRTSYRLRPEDQLQLEVFREPELSKVAEIGRDGKASFPLIESVELAGMTMDEAKQKIWELYEADFLVAPSLNLTIAQYAREYVSVTGQVVNPGDVPIPNHGRLSLFTAITNAGGLTSFADEKNIQVFSTRGTESSFSLEQVRGETGKTFLLATGDQVVVPKNRFANSVVSVQGEVVRPGTVSIPPDGNLDLATALTAAGGPGLEADRSRIELIRAESSRISTYSYETIKSGSAGRLTLRGGDRIVVRKSPFVGKRVSVLGEVGRKGFVDFPVDGKLTLREAITLAGGLTDLANQKVKLERRGVTTKDFNLEELARQGLVVYLQPDDRITAMRRFF